MYDDLCKSVNDAYRKAIIENPDIGIRELANSIGQDFLIVWVCLRIEVKIPLLLTLIEFFLLF